MDKETIPGDEHNVPDFVRVQFTYTVKMANLKNAYTYGKNDGKGYASLYTNKIAVLTPVDSRSSVSGEKVNDSASAC